MSLEIIKNNKIRTVETTQLFLGCKALISWVYVCLKKEIDRKMLDFEAAELSEVLKSEFKGLTLSEIRTAFLKGIRKEYNTPCIANYLKWIESYQNEEKASNTTTESDTVRARLSVKNDLSDSEKETIAQNAFAFCFETYKDKGVVYDIGGTIYLWACRVGKIKLTREDQDRIKLLVQKEENERLTRNRELAIAKLNRSDVKKIDSEMDNLFEEQNTSIEMLCRKKALKEYFESR